MLSNQPHVDRFRTRRPALARLSRTVAPALVTGVTLSALATGPATAPSAAAASAASSAAAAPLAPVAATRVFVSRITARPSAIRDSAGNRWERLPLTVGTSSRRAYAGVSSARGNAALYSWVASNARGYQLQVPAGSYRVRLLFTEPEHTAAGKRVFDVVAERATRVRGLDIARQAGRLRAHDVTFTVPVRDGSLDLRFVPRAGKPVISGIEVVSAGRVRVPASTAAARAVALAPASPYFQKVRTAPLAANSSRLIAGLAAQVRDNWGGTAATNAYQYNGAFYPVAPGTRRVRVGFHDCQRKGRVPAGLYDGAGHFLNVPVPPEAIPASGRDGQLTIYDRKADQLWEFWQMRRSSSGGWEACWGGRIDKVSASNGQFPFPFGASASGLPVAAGMITIAEARAGKISHAMSLAVIEAANWDTFSWPANRSDGFTTNPHALMEGQRIRLDPRVNLDRYDLTPFGRMVAEAAQEYGFIVTDRSGAVAVSTESGAAEKARTGEDPWRTLLGGESYLALKNFPWDRMQALPKDYGKL